MDESKSGMGWLAVLFIVLVIWLIFGGNMGGNSARGGACGASNGCITNCQVEKQEIIDSARTQYLIETTSQQTQNVLGTKIDFYAYENLRDQLAQARTQNVVLENRVYSDNMFNAMSRQLADCCCATERRLDGIECNMLKRPHLFGVASTCSGQLIPPLGT